MMAPSGADESREGAIPTAVVKTTVTYLEILSPPGGPPPPLPRSDLVVERMHHPSTDAYRRLYQRVGREYFWTERLLMSDEALERVLSNPCVEVHLLRVAGETAGYTELCRCVPGEVQLAYFGLFPEFQGQRLGPYLLDWSIRTAFTPGVRRFWVHTCTLDHPAALTTYDRAGFKVFDRREACVSVPS